MTDILDFTKKAFLTSIGLALTAKDEVEDLAKDLEKKMSMGEEEGKKFFHDVQKRYEETQTKLEARVEKSVKEFLKKSDIVSSDELKALKKEIRELKKTINQGSEKSEG